VLLWVQFDGTDFAGYQRQADGVRTVAGTLEAAWLRMLGEPVVARSSSRTDSGVHARRMPVLIFTDRLVPPGNLVRGLNTFLPDDIAVLEAADVTAEFEVRADAVGKRYVYRLMTGEARLPLWRRVAWFVRGELDFAAMQAGAAHLVGIHDFAAFRASSCTAPSTIRNLRSIELAREGALLTLTVEGNAFLHNMVRIIAGTLVDVGRKRVPPDAVAQMLLGRDRVRAGQTAPAQGLTLDEVFYGPHGARQGLDYKELLAHMNVARAG